MPFISKTPKPPYVAVVFTSVNAAVDDADHAEHIAMSARMVELAGQYPGFLGIEPARNGDGSGVAVSYWRDMDSVRAWAVDPEHQIAKQNGRERWYANYMIRIARVEREYGRPD